MKNLRKRISVIAVFLVAIMIFGSVTVFADDFVIDPFRIVSEDGSRVFIYTPHPHFHQERDSILPATGLYYNTEPLELIYLIEDIGWAFESDFVFSSDFRHLAFFGRMSFDVALEFYEDGILIKRYMIDDLVEDMNEVSISTSRAWWEERAGRSFDITNNTLTITTYDNLTYVFDITTGEIIESSGVSGFQHFIPVLVGVGLVVCVAIIFAVRNYRKTDTQ